jgi:Rad3-related DNA helicase
MPFKTLGLHPALVRAVREMNYAEPTPIQVEAIPVILSGRDLIATAQTGTGKTAAFLLPVLHQLMALPPGATQALVITPTRELAQQIDDVLLGLAYHTNLRAGLIVGGTPMAPQEKALRSGVEFLVATPGRLLDHMRQNQCGSQTGSEGDAATGGAAEESQTWAPQLTAFRVVSTCKAPQPHPVDGQSTVFSLSCVGPADYNNYVGSCGLSWP